MKKLPIGRRESETLEFKGTAALDQSEKIARAAVALLNGKLPGELWIGIREENEVAVAAEDLGDTVEARRRALEDAFADLIEPPPTADELRVETVEHKSYRLLRVECSGQRRPYALRLPKGGRLYVIRRGAAIRPMTREEISTAFKATAAEPVPEKRQKELLKSRQSALHQGEARFWLGICPAKSVSLDVQSQEIGRIMTEPAASGNRQGPVWSVVSERLERQLRNRRVEFGEDPHRVLQLNKTGLLSFRAPLRILTEPNFPTRLHPFAVLEYPASFARLAAAIFRLTDLADDDLIFLDLAISGARDWTLLPNSPRTFGFDIHPARTLDGDDLVDDPIQVRWGDLRAEPDRAAMRLVNEVYQAFGYDRSWVPREYDPGTGRLTL